MRARPSTNRTKIALERPVQRSSVVEEDTKGKGVAYKDMHTLYEAEQRRADKLSRGEAAGELKNEGNSE